MIKNIIFSLFLTVFSVKSAEILTEKEINNIANAIFKAENSKKYPYGVKSIDTKGNIEYARRICINSIKNNHKRWINAGKPEDFISFMSRRYCPIGAPDDPNNLNKNWVKNVKKFLAN